jgi:hypothetical protein
MIGSYPTETLADFYEFVETIKQVCPVKPILIKMHVSTFRPSPLTPSAYLPVNLKINWRNLSETYKLKKSGGDIFKTENLVLSWGMYIESTMQVLKQIIIERATEESDQLINTILFSKKLKQLKANQQLLAIQDKFDLIQYTREYDVNEKLPTWYLESYISNDVIKRTAQKLKKNLGLTSGV